MRLFGFRHSLAIVLLASIAPGCASAHRERIGSQTGGTDAFHLFEAASRLAREDLWPGFTPASIPVAIYDGERTFLFRHPDPPEGFQPVPAQNDVSAYPGRHPAVSANSSTTLGGVETATLMATGGGDLRSRASVLVHEMFHVFQRRRHPGWTANETELFVYPVTDAQAVALRRLETEALRRALSERDPATLSCWTRTALEVRRERFAALPAGAAAYERGTELNEGLATYVERRATGRVADVLAAGEVFAPAEVRRRAYEAGAAMALLLDRFSPAWRTALEADDTTPLDVLLSTALPANTGNADSCTFSADERAGALSAATADVRALENRWRERRREFLERDGWRLIVAAPDMPLFPQGFDPLNVQPVAAGEVLHTRFLRLGNDAGEIEVLGRHSLTVSAGAHPLFNGVRTLTVTGLAEAPRVSDTSGRIEVSADGVKASFARASVEREARSVTIRLVPTNGGLR